MLNFTNKMGQRVVEPGEFELMLGTNSDAIQQCVTVNLTGDKPVVLARDWRMLSHTEETAG